MKSCDTAAPIVETVGRHHRHHMRAHRQAGIEQAHLPGRVVARDPGLPARWAHRVVTGIAVEEHQLGKQPVADEPLADQAVQKRFGGHQLADHPKAQAIGRALALDIVTINLKVCGLDVGEGVELEAQRRVSRAHHFVVDGFARAAHVTVQTQACARRRLRKRVQAVGHVLCMGVARDMRAQPILTAAVAGFAAHAVAELEAATATLGGHEVAVAGQTFGRFMRRFRVAQIGDNSF